MSDQLDDLIERFYTPQRLVVLALMALVLSLVSTPLGAIALIKLNAETSKANTLSKSACERSQKLTPQFALLYEELDGRLQLRSINPEFLDFYRETIPKDCEGDWSNSIDELLKKGQDKPSTP